MPVRLKDFSVQHFAGYNQLKWTTASEQNTSKFYIEFSTDAISFIRAGQLPALRNANGGNYSFQHNIASATVFYRLAIEEDDGRINYSSILKISSADASNIKLYPTIVKGRTLNLSLAVPANKLQVVNSNGSVVFKKSLNNTVGATIINLPALSKGMYLVNVLGTNGSTTNKIIID